MYPELVEAQQQQVAEALAAALSGAREPTAARTD
jgi:hypothetical protein